MSIFAFGVPRLYVHCMPKVDGPAPNEFTREVRQLAFVIGAFVGGVYGYAKGAELRLRAQLLLCQLQTEINTRRAQAQAPATQAAATST